MVDKNRLLMSFTPMPNDHDEDNEDDEDDEDDNNTDDTKKKVDNSIHQLYNNYTNNESV